MATSNTAIRFRVFMPVVRAALIAALLVGPSLTQAEQYPAAGEGLQSDDAIGYLLLLGEESLSQDRFGEAIARFSEVLRHDWNYPRAFDLLQEARQRRSETLRRWELRGRRAYRNKDWPLAILNFERVLAEDSTRGDLRSTIRRMRIKADAARLVRVGLEKFILEDYAGAQFDFEQALAINPGDSAAVMYLDRAAQKLFQSSSLADLQADPDAWTKYREALLKFRAGELAAADRLWREILLRFPGNESVRSNLEQIARRLDQEPVAARE